MSLRIYNTRSRCVEEFQPADEAQVTLYVCGPTVYNLVHVGNARPFVVFDVLYRLLRRSYPHVVYARNLTDVDDKINAAALANGEPIGALAQRYIDAFHQDMAALNTLPPDFEPRATETIDTMIELIGILVSRDHAYESAGHVLFSVTSMPAYGGLSGRKQEDLVAGARVSVADYKRDAADFVLWKPSKPGEPEWDSPWGKGRPGWHLECSAMIHKHLGRSIDIHAGGQDLIFPHHENEMAQSCCAYPGETFVRYWMHNGYVTLAGEKMSKSEGNFFTLRDVLGKYPGEVIRYALLSGHYRKPLDWCEAGLQQAHAALQRLYQALRPYDVEEPARTTEPDGEVLRALEDDLNSPRALARLHEMAAEINKGEGDVAALAARLQASGGLLGLLMQPAEDWFQGSNSGTVAEDAQIEDLIAAREAARTARDYACADAIRAQLQAMGVTLEDGAGGTRWRRAAGVHSC